MSTEATVIQKGQGSISVVHRYGNAHPTSTQRSQSGFLEVTVMEGEAERRFPWKTQPIQAKTQIEKQQAILHVGVQVVGDGVEACEAEEGSRAPRRGLALWARS